MADGTPVKWNIIEPQNIPFIAVVEDEDTVTVNGIASATFQLEPPSCCYQLMVTASVGSVSVTDIFVPLTYDPADTFVTLTTTPKPWMLVEIGDAIIVTASAVQPNSEAMPGSGSNDASFFAPQLTQLHSAMSTYTVANLVTGGHLWPGATTFSLSPALQFVSATDVVGGSASVTYRVVGRGAVRALSSFSSPWWSSIILDNLGAYPDPPADLALSLRLPADSDNTVPTDSALGVGATLTYTGKGQNLYVSDGAMRIAGAYEWETTGRNGLAVPGQTVNTFSAAYPDTCKGVSVDGQTDWTCTVELNDATIYIPAGTPNGTFTISGTVTVNGRKYTDTLEVTVVAPGSIDEVAEVQFDFAERERGANRGEPYPANIPVGGDTKFRLKVLNEHGKASATGSIASILLTTTIGSLSADIGTDCTGGSTCQIPVSAITAANADKIDISLTYAADSKAGRGEVRATVIAGDGETFSRGPISVTLVGAAASLAISEPATSLLSSATTADDNRDVLKLTITAADAEGNSVDVPYRTPRATIKGTNGNIVSSGIGVVWTEDGDDTDEAHDQFTLNAAKAVEATISVTAEAASPLEVGEYTLELRTAGNTATRTFTIVGEAASVALGEPQGSLELNGTVSFTAMVRDAAGAPAADGTPVVWSALSTSESPVLVQLSADTSTRDGAATATYLSVNAGTAIVAAESGDGREVRVMTIAAAPAAVGDAAPPDPSESLSNRGRLGFAVWLGERATSASALLDSLSEINSILLWQDSRWQRYGRHEGRIIPGSYDFQIPRGTIIWLDR